MTRVINRLIEKWAESTRTHKDVVREVEAMARLRTTSTVCTGEGSLALYHMSVKVSIEYRY